MRIIIAGSRTVRDYRIVERAMSLALAAWAGAGVTCEQIISGGCRGVDLLGEEWAERRGIPIARFDADWKQHGKSAGPIRNVLMVNSADALVAVWNGKSLGTRNIICLAWSLRLKLWVEMV